MTDIDSLFTQPCPRLPDGRPVSIPDYQAKHPALEAGTEHDFKSFFKRWPWLYNLLFAMVGPAFLTGKTSKKFVQSLGGSAPCILHAGCGPRRIDGCINVDLYAFPGVDVIADLHELPFKDNTFDAVTCDQVLEHIEHPHRVVAELQRVTKPGGLLHVACPFMHPWHPSPRDYTRWTQEGLRSMFTDCTLVEEGVMAGPFSALNAFLPAFLATIFSCGSKRLQGILQYLFLVICMPLKLGDIIFGHLAVSQLCADNFYVVVQKNDSL